MTMALYAMALMHIIAVLTKSTTFYTIGTAALTITVGSPLRSSFAEMHDLRWHAMCLLPPSPQIVFSNAVVWSRVWVLWGYNTVLCIASFLLLLITLGEFTVRCPPPSPPCQPVESFPALC